MSFHRNAKLGLAGRYALVCAIERGMTLKAAGAAFSVSPATAHRWWHRWAEASEEARASLSCLFDRSHPGRIRSEAAFARLAGCAPIPASSGPTIRYRLDRSDDRQLNRAPHMILVTRRQTHPPTITYINRRIQDGKTRRQATAASSATSPATSTDCSNTHQPALDIHRSNTGAGDPLLPGCQDADGAAPCSRRCCVGLASSHERLA
jgi:Transposase IS116/IS110/IS902 family